MLQRVQAHPRDAQIIFEEEGHRYTLSLGPSNSSSPTNPTSVTTLIHKFFPHFDPDKILDKMFRSGRLAPRYQGKTKEQIKAEWDENGRVASELGTQMHADIERFLNQEPVLDSSTTEYQHFERFWADFTQTYPMVQPFRTEWLVFDEDVGIAGSIDCSIATPNGDLILIDWKRSKEIKRSNSYEKGFGPFAQLDNCNYNHYMLQLNIYRHLLESKYQKRVIFMMLVILHPNNPSYQCIEIPTYPIAPIWTQITDPALEFQK